jgi:hypothetical protein
MVHRVKVQRMEVRRKEGCVEGEVLGKKEGKVW